MPQAPYWPGRRVLVTGGRGFLGRRVVRRLRAAGADVSAPGSRDYDLRDRRQAADLFSEEDFATVIHLAARVGGIGYNRAHPAELFLDNALMGAHVIDEAYRAGVERLLVVGTICSYPKHTPTPFREETFWDGYPEETNAPYGLAKRGVITQAAAYRAQYGFRTSAVVPVNLYGPEDNFDPQSSHVIPAMIRKMSDARGGAVTLWGTGTPTREFLFVEDAAEAIVRAAEKHDSSDIINLGTGREVAIRALAEKVAAAVGYRGEVRWDAAMPAGQPRRVLDVARARAVLGWAATTPLDVGLAQTAAWWRAQRAQGVA